MRYKIQHIDLVFDGGRGAMKKATVDARTASGGARVSLELQAMVIRAMHSVGAWAATGHGSVVRVVQAPLEADPNIVYLERQHLKVRKERKGTYRVHAFGVDSDRR